MLRARVKSSLHRIKMDNSVTLWELHIILMQTRFLLMSRSVQPHLPIQKNHPRLGQVPSLRRIERNMRNVQLMIHSIHQNNIQAPSRIKLKERNPQLRYSLHSLQNQIKKFSASAVIFTTQVRKFCNVSSYQPSCLPASSQIAVLVREQGSHLYYYHFLHPHFLVPYFFFLYIAL